MQPSPLQGPQPWPRAPLCPAVPLPLPLQRASMRQLRLHQFTGCRGERARLLGRPPHSVNNAMTNCDPCHEGN